MPPTEKVGEIKALKSMVRQDKDVKPEFHRAGRGGWRWEQGNQWPPLDLILRTAFWSAEEYEPVRKRLLRPAPQITVMGGGELLSVQFVLDKEYAHAGEVADLLAETDSL